MHLLVRTAVSLLRQLSYRWDCLCKIIIKSVLIYVTACFVLIAFARQVLQSKRGCCAQEMVETVTQLIKVDQTLIGDSFFPSKKPCTFMLKESKDLSQKLRLKMPWILFILSENKVQFTFLVIQGFEPLIPVFCHTQLTQRLSHTFHDHFEVIDTCSYP